MISGNVAIKGEIYTFHMEKDDLTVFFDLRRPREREFFIEAFEKRSLGLEKLFLRGEYDFRTIIFCIEPDYEFRLTEQVILFKLRYAFDFDLLGERPIERFDFEIVELLSIYPPSDFYSFEPSLMLKPQTQSKKQNFDLENEKCSSYFSVIFGEEQREEYPLRAIPRFTIECEPISDGYSVVDRYLSFVKRYFSFLSHTFDIHIQNITLLTKNDDGKYQRIGSFIYLGSDLTGTRSEANPRCITYKQIANKEQELLNDIANRKLYLDHLPETYSPGHALSIGRYITVMSGFEWEYGRFPNKSEIATSRKPEQNAVRKEIKALRDGAKEKPKERKIYDDLLTNMDNDRLARKIKSIYNLLKYEIDGYATRIYDEFMQTYQEKGFWERVSYQRNCFAHGNITVIPDQQTWLDFLIFERLLLTMQLSHYIDNPEQRKEAIIRLLGPE